MPRQPDLLDEVVEHRQERAEHDSFPVRDVDLANLDGRREQGPSFPIRVNGAPLLRDSPKIREFKPPRHPEPVQGGVDSRYGSRVR